jgi:penicillin-binding protein 2
VAVTPVQLARTIGGIAMGGTFYRPHVVNPADLPKGYQNAAVTAGQPEVVHVPIDPQNWMTITNAMGEVVNPASPSEPEGGTAPSAHILGVDFAGKTGSAQVVSNEFRKTKGGGASRFKDNSWFVGVTPRRNPEIVVAVLFEGGEHGKLAARLAAQVIKAYVEKQRSLRNDPMLFSDKADPGSVPIAGVWNAPHVDDDDNAGQSEVAEHFQGGTFVMKTGANIAQPKRPRLPALGASGAD